MNNTQKVKLNQYNTVSAICEESYAKSMAALAEGNIEEAQKHIEVFRKYNLIQQEIEAELETS